MKKLKNLKKILLMLLLILCICGISNVNMATDTGDVNDILPIPDMGTSTQPTPTPTPTLTPGNLGGDNTNSTSLPKTGANDTVMWVLIGCSIVFAVYTYKKVKDYTI